MNVRWNHDDETDDWIIIRAFDWFFPFGILQMNAAPSAFLHKQQVTVYTGDSLWSIASRHTEDGEDVRNVIERIIDANKLDRKAALQPGQKLIIPVQGDKDQKLASNQ